MDECQIGRGGINRRQATVLGKGTETIGLQLYNPGMKPEGLDYWWVSPGWNIATMSKQP